MKIAFLFSGQGAQYPDMGKDLYRNYDSTKAVFDSIVTDFDVKTLCFGGPKEQLDNTQYAQVAIFTHAMAVTAILQENDIRADVTVGLNLGKYNALCCVNYFSVQAGAEILRGRGKLMANAFPSGTSAMAAVLMLDKEAILNACEAIQKIGVCEIANYNCPGQITITDEKVTVEVCGKKCLEAGTRRVIPLQVSDTFHSPLLQEAGRQLYQVPSAYKLKTSRTPVLHNLTAGIADRPLIDLLDEQISHNALLEDTIRSMLADDVDTSIEVGPGKAVSGFVKKCTRGMGVNMLHVGGTASPVGTLGYMKG